MNFSLSAFIQSCQGHVMPRSAEDDSGQLDKKLNSYITTYVQKSTSPSQGNIASPHLT